MHARLDGRPVVAIFGPCRRALSGGTNMSEMLVSSMLSLVSYAVVCGFLGVVLYEAVLAFGV